MPSSLVSKPLQQALLALWLFGLVRLLGSLVDAPPGAKWAAAALVASLVLALLGARHRLLAVLPVAIALGSGAVLAAGRALGVDYPAQLGPLMAGCGLALWQVAVSALRGPLSYRLVAGLKLAGGYGSHGGRRLSELYVYWSCFALMLLGLGADLSQDLRVPGVPGGSWPVLLAAGVFFTVTGYRHRRPLNTYLGLAVVFFAAVGVLLALRPLAASTREPVLALDDLALGLILVGLSAFGLVASRLLEFLQDRDERSTVDLERLYARPLSLTAVALSVLALAQVLGLATVGAAVPGWMTITVLAGAGATLLYANRTFSQPLLTAAAALAWSFACLWLFSGLTYARSPAGLWSGGGAEQGEWLVLALLALTLALLGHWIGERPRWRRAFGLPLLAVAGLGHAWCLAGALALYPSAPASLPWILATLGAGLFPLLRPLRSGIALRGLGVVLLLSFFVAAVLGADRVAEAGAFAGLSWAFMLWIGSTELLPRLNAYLGPWSVSPASWPWLGLLVTVLCVGLVFEPGTMHWGLCLSTGCYLLLMTRHSSWSGFAWLGVSAVSLGIVLLGVEHVLMATGGNELESVGSLALANLFWANLLLALIPVWTRRGAWLCQRLSWPKPSLRGPLLCNALLLCVIWLAALALWDGLSIFFGLGVLPRSPLVVLLGVVLSVSVLHICANWPRALAAHLLVATVAATAVAAWAGWRPFQLPLVVGAVGLALAVGSCLIPANGPAPMRPLRRACLAWARVVPALGVVCIALDFNVPLVEQLATGAFLAGIAVLLGWRDRSRIWLWIGLGFTALILHGIWLYWIAWEEILWLLPVYALQFALAGAGLRCLNLIVTRAPRASFGRWLRRPWVRRLLEDGQRAAIALGAVEWGLHLLHTVLRALAGLPLSGATNWPGDAAAIATGLVLTLAFAFEAARLRREGAWYAAAAFLALTAVYARIAWVGLMPLSPWDTGAVIAAAYAMFLLQHLTGFRPAKRLNMILPLAALATVPAQLHSAAGSLSLFAIGALYLLTRRSSGRAAPLCLGLLIINLGVYLWVPDWARHFGLLQLYVIPASLSVLLLVHLHRTELRSHVLSGARLAALSAIFGSAAVDVFLQESLGVFVLALALSLGGVTLGVMTRTRAFLYAGLAFLVINVLGQLLQLYPEQRLGRALLLMVLGATITAAMIWFNLKREAILQRLRIVRADLATWD